MNFHQNYLSNIIVNFIFIVILKVSILSVTIDANNIPDSNNIQSVLAELEKLSSAIKNVGSINERLISTLRDNVTRNNLKSRKAEDFVKIGYSCTDGVGWHKLHSTNLTWNEARKSCRKEDAHLAILNSDDEAKALKKLLLENYQFSAYIGIHNQFKEDEWVTVFGDPLIETGYNSWSVGPPKISQANCGVLYEDGKLLGIPCHVERSYFCEIPGMPSC